MNRQMYKQRYKQMERFGLMHKFINLMIIIAMLLLAFSCTTVQVKIPDGFALVKKSRVYKAVSPEGLLYKIKYVDNYPKKNLDFWEKALKNQLIKAGYQYLREEEFTAATQQGVLFEWAAPFGNENYIYLTAIVVSGKYIIIAEAAGEFKLYNQYKETILQSLTTVVLK